MHDATASTDPLASVHIEKHRDARREMKRAHGSGEFVCAQRSQRSLGQILASLALAKRSFRWIPPECGVVMKLAARPRVHRKNLGFTTASCQPGDQNDVKEVECHYNLVHTLHQHCPVLRLNVPLEPL